MFERFRGYAAPTALVVLSLAPHDAAAQASGHDAAPRGSFVASDSLDASKEPGTASRTRHERRGTATWTIERDTLDLRRKFTIRLELPAPSPVAIVVRALDSLPPAPGRYAFFVGSSGRSHSRPGEMHASINTREGERDNSYLPVRDTLVITSTRPVNGAPVVSGYVVLRAERYSDARTTSRIRDYVWLDVTGHFEAVPARERQPAVAITETMQRAVLERALDGFGITWMGAVNGDGAVDSTHSPARGRAFLESRWRDALVVEHVDASDRSFRVRLRGRFAPVVCEQASTDMDIECVTLPAAAAAGSGAGGRGDVSGTLRGLAPAAPNGGKAVTVFLVPNPAPVRDAFAALCAKRDKRDRAGEAALEAKMARMTTMQQMDSVLQSLVYASLATDDRENERLISGVAVRRASVNVGATFAFPAVPAGNYLLFATLPTTPIARHWYVPVVVQSGKRTMSDLDSGNVSQGGWGCVGPHPFPMIHERER